MKSVKVIFKGNSWLYKCINSVYRDEYRHLDDFDHHRTYDKKVSEKLFCAAVWCLCAAFCSLCWFFVMEYFL